MIIVVTQQKGGAGKSTIAAHLTLGAALRGASVCLVDIDPQGSLNAWHQLRSARADADQLQQFAFKSIKGWQVEGELSSYKQRYDLVIVDTPPHANQDAKASIRAADDIIVPMQPGPLDLWASQSTVDLAHKYGKRPKILLNRVNSRAKLTAEISDQIRQKDVDLLDQTVGNRILFAEAMAQGLSVMEVQKNAQASREIMAVLDIIL
ncbi:MAG: ParA family partition ATPase [Alphaproteobacteria bacterium]